VTQRRDPEDLQRIFGRVMKAMCPRKILETEGETPERI
jgi:hypothetical protein